MGCGASALARQVSAALTPIYDEGDPLLASYAAALTLELNSVPPAAPAGDAEQLLKADAALRADIEQRRAAGKSLDAELHSALATASSAIERNRRPVERWWTALDAFVATTGRVVGGTGDTAEAVEGIQRQALFSWCINVQRCLRKRLVTIEALRGAWGVEPLSLEAFEAATRTTRSPLHGSGGGVDGWRLARGLVGFGGGDESFTIVDHAGRPACVASGFALRRRVAFASVSDGDYAPTARCLLQKARADPDAQWQKVLAAACPPSLLANGGGRWQQAHVKYSASAAPGSDRVDRKAPKEAWRLYAFAPSYAGQPSDGRDRFGENVYRHAIIEPHLTSRLGTIHLVRHLGPSTADDATVLAADVQLCRSGKLRLQIRAVPPGADADAGGTVMADVGLEAFVQAHAPATGMGGLSAFLPVPAACHAVEASRTPLLLDAASLLGGANLARIVLLAFVVACEAIVRETEEAEAASLAAARAAAAEADLVGKLAFADADPEADS